MMYGTFNSGIGIAVALAELVGKEQTIIRSKPVLRERIPFRKSPARNGACPCSSGKKYKVCCRRKSMV